MITKVRNGYCLLTKVRNDNGYCLLTKVRNDMVTAY